MYLRFPGQKILANKKPAATEIEQKRWRWTGYTPRKLAANTTGQVPAWNPHGKKKTGRPMNTIMAPTPADRHDSNGNDFGHVERMIKADNVSRAPCDLCR
ncbi:hypothetical protein ElyMa_003087100 [Elysia marginata]|uniref:Uncharacterized protein n=1 Tax=Elysia marginata TaxID=1093978 RepID=A0AAV4ILQ6_9GAST|nr:hypothetical protein ElyMa_003087100 [Elysia marginata]